MLGIRPKNIENKEQTHELFNQLVKIWWHLASSHYEARYISQYIIWW